MSRTFGRRELLAGAAALAAVGCAPAPAFRARSGSSLSSRGIREVIGGVASRDGAGVSLTRHTARAQLEALDPFIMLDEIHSSVPSDYERGFPSHPHRGFETVSIMLDGRMRHRDSRGNSGLIEGGGAQWMTAGRGIVHSEMPENDPAISTELWGFQLWVNLPRAQKMRAPEYQDLQADRLAEVELDRGGRLRVIAGELLGARGPVADRPTEPVLATLAMERGDDVELHVPRDHNALVLVADGEASIGARRERLGEGALAILDPRGELVRITASDRAAQILVIAGAPIREPIAHRGPFVMNTQEELDEAFADYRAGTLG